MANTAKFAPLFRCTRSHKVGATESGDLAMVELVEVNGTEIALACPLEGVREIINRLQTALDMAQARNQNTMYVPGEHKAPPAPLATDHQVTVSDDANSLVLKFQTGTAPLFVQVSRSRSPKLRASLEAAEKQAAEKKRLQTN